MSAGWGPLRDGPVGGWVEGGGWVQGEHDSAPTKCLWEKVRMGGGGGTMGTNLRRGAALNVRDRSNKTA